MTVKKNYTTTYTINGHEYKVTAPALINEQTGKPVADKELDDAAAEKAREMYRKDMDFFSPKDLKDYRQRTGLSQRNLAELTGLSPNTIALYESGAFPTIANNNMLKALINNDQVLKQYLQNGKEKYSKTLIKKITSYLRHDNNLILEENKAPQFSAVQLANWFRVTNYFDFKADQNIDPLTQMKVIKLLYFAYGRHLVATHSKLFTSPILHYQYGPLVEEVHEKFYGQVTIVGKHIDEEALNDYSEVSQNKELVELLKGVNDSYGNYTAFGLSKITHKPGSPWSQTEQNDVISDQKIFQAFSTHHEE